MPQLFLRYRDGVLLPAFQEDRDVVSTLKQNDTLRANVIKFRNADLFRKWQTLVTIAYGLRDEIGAPRMSAKKFRQELVKLSGFYEQIFSATGNEFRIEAQSIAWANMDEDEFEQLYDASLDVLMRCVFEPRYTRKQVDRWVAAIIEFS